MTFTIDDELLRSDVYEKLILFLLTYSAFIAGEPIMLPFL